MKTFFSILGIIIAFVVIVFWLQYFWLANYKFFAPKYQEARRNVFENTQSYVEGKRQEISKYMYEYSKSDEEWKKAICSLVRNSMANIDKSHLNYEQNIFIDSCYK